MSIYDYVVKDKEGKEVSLSNYRGKVLLIVNTATGCSFTPQFDGLQDLYEKYGVLCNLSGHIHMQHLAQSDSGLPEMVTSSLMVWPNQYGVLTLEGKSAEYHTASVAADQPELADATHAFFWDNAYGQAMSSLGEEADEALGRFFADANTAYFAGRLDQLPWDEEQVEAWQTSGARFASYFETIADDRLDQTVLTFDFD